MIFQIFLFRIFSNFQVISMFFFSLKMLDTCQCILPSNNCQSISFTIITNLVRHVALLQFGKADQRIRQYIICWFHSNLDEKTFLFCIQQLWNFLSLNYKYFYQMRTQANIVDLSPNYHSPHRIQSNTQFDFNIHRFENWPNPQAKNSKEWSEKEVAKYLIFVEKNEKKMEGRSHRLLWRVYREMQKFVGTRNFRQCKIKHQRMIEKYGTISGIFTQSLTNFAVSDAAMEDERKNIAIFYCKLQEQSESVRSINPNEKYEKPTSQDYEDDSLELFDRIGNIQLFDRNFFDFPFSEKNEYLSQKKNGCIKRWIDLFSSFSIEDFL